MSQAADFLLDGIGQLITFDGCDGPAAGNAMAEFGTVADAAVAAKDGIIVSCGERDKVLAEMTLEDGAQTFSAGGRCVTPGLVDAHTHVVFAGSREAEFEKRIKGASYMEITREGGGIRSTVRMTNDAGSNKLIADSLRRLTRMLSFGTTTAEAKTGYSLSTDGELRLLEILARLAELQPVDLVPTFLGAHSVPEEYDGKKDAYVDLVIEKMLPEVETQGIAKFCDVFCEEGVFDVNQSRRILSEGLRRGMRPKLHADEIESTGGAELAAELNAISADHLPAISGNGIDALADSGTIAVCLPGTVMSLGNKKYAPARRMIERGCAIALGTDLNPGTSMTESMQIVISLACMAMKMTPMEALCASTLNSACACGVESNAGSVSTGKFADMVVWEFDDYRHLPYHFGVNLVNAVVKRGDVVSGELGDAAGSRS